ncbi:transcription initiation factor TFIID subunit 11 [Mycoemilia scoparia]|uniref:Transcription initiation factor TFIID subunit 11 n=1 Tax=Mycoemilia scoparia TaxID=417184 RepID=A0A9W8A005_9FUNG|nr:transcription initiation factor TFIID subunit 11 [Mycoemilia scoparia]
MPDKPNPKTPDSAATSAKKRKLSSITPHTMLRLNSKRRNSPLVSSPLKTASLSRSQSKNRLASLGSAHSKASGLSSRRGSNLGIGQTSSPGHNEAAAAAAHSSGKGKAVMGDQADGTEKSVSEPQANNGKDAVDGGEESNSDDDDVDSTMASQSLNEPNYQLIKQSKDEIRRMLEGFTEEQRERYNIYRRTVLNKASIKKLATQILNQPISATLVFVIAGFSKVFVGEVIEEAKEVMREWGDEGGIAPAHLREAQQRIRSRPESAPNPLFEKRLF